jgi:hypothetical protein
MKWFRTARQLTRQERRLLLEAFITLAVCGARLRIQNVKKLQAWSTRVGNGSITVNRLAWAVDVASKRMPGVTCLSRALALQRLLSKNRHGSELRIGVEKNDDRFGAHAWLVRGGQVLIGAPELEKYELLAAWQARIDVSKTSQKKAAQL